MNMIYGLLAQTLIERLAQPNVIIGIVLCAIGIALACLARRIACSSRKTSEVANDDSIMVTVKIIGLIFIVVALVVMVIK